MRDPRDLASAIKELRGERTQKEVAEKAGVDSTTWSAYEKGERFPRGAERLERMAQALGCTLSRFEEIMWRHRTHRLAIEDLAMKTSPPEAGAAVSETREENAARAFIQERLTNIFREMEDLIVFLVEEKHSA
jgi:transcriptional regulator with XRE-family HTH domain